MMENKPETLRELKEGDKPRPGEVIWSIGDPITNADQYRLAKAIKKRLTRGARAMKSIALECDLQDVSKAIYEWENK